MKGHLTEPMLFQPWCSRRLDIDELNEQLAPTLRLLDAMPPSATNLASALRKLRWSIRLGDTVWLTTEPPNHPDFCQGTASVEVIRNGQVAARCRYSPFDCALQMPPRTLDRLPDSPRFSRLMR